MFIPNHYGEINFQSTAYHVCILILRHVRRVYTSRLTFIGIHIPILVLLRDSCYLSSSQQQCRGSIYIPFLNSSSTRIIQLKLSYAIIAIHAKIAMIFNSRII
jgi:hypothetical protein